MRQFSQIKITEFEKSGLTEAALTILAFYLQFTVECQTQIRVQSWTRTSFFFMRFTAPTVFNFKTLLNCKQVPQNFGTLMPIPNDADLILPIICSSVHLKAILHNDITSFELT